MKPIVDIIEDFIGTINLSGPILSATTDGTYTTLTLENPYHARAEMLISIDGTDRKIQSVSGRDIVVAGVLNAPQEYKISTPVYYHGTPLLTNAHISQARPSQKYPMIYLYEIIKEKDNDEDNRIRKEAELRLFFLDTANFGEWSTDDHYSKRLIGLNRLVNGFVKELKKSKCFYTFETVFTRSNHPNWGVYLGEKGHVSRIFDDDLTGVELSFLLQVRECCAEKVEPPENPKTIIEGFEFPAGTEFMKFEADFRTERGYIEATKTGNNFYIITNATKYEVAADGNRNGTMFEYGSSQDNFTVPVYLITTDGWSGFTELSFIEGINQVEKMLVFMRQYPQNFQKLVNLEYFRLASIYRTSIGQEFIKNNKKLKTVDSRQNEGCFDYIQFSKAGFKDTLAVLLSDLEESFFYFDCDMLQLTRVGLTDNFIRYDKGFANSKITNAQFRSASFYSIDDLDKIIIDLDAANNSPGFLDYRNTISPTSTAYTAYISLISKGWTILGNPPPAP